MISSSARKAHLVVHIILIISAIAMLVPFVWMVLTSLKTTTEATQIPIRYFPDAPSLRGYIEAIKQSEFPHYYLNTIISAVMKTVFPVIFSSMAAYAFARIRFPGSSILFILLLSVMMVPNPVFYTPQYMMMSELGLVNTVTALWIASLISPFATFLLRQFFMSISKELEEASVLDGCNPFQIYWHIMLPLVRSALVAIVIIQLQWAWNELQWPLIINSSPEKMTLSSGIATLVSMFGTDYPVLMAGAFMAVVPMIILFFIFQKQFIEGIAFSATKG